MDDTGVRPFCPSIRNCGQHPAAFHIACDTVALHDVAVDLNGVPCFGVPDVIDRNVVMLAPEERHGAERLALPKHVERRGLTLALGDDPVLDANVGARNW